MTRGKGTVGSGALPGFEAVGAAAGTAATGGGGEERFDQLMGRLEDLVKSLEKGDLPLEDSLKAFEEGVGLVRRGQARLEQMERRVEVLMTDGSTRPFQENATGRGEAAPAPVAARTTRVSDDDIPF